jgi:hypothetical protein
MGGRTAAKDQKGVEYSREAKLRAGQGYKLLTLVAGLSPAMHALAARVNKTPKNNFASAQRSICFLFGET